MRSTSVNVLRASEGVYPCRCMQRSESEAWADSINVDLHIRAPGCNEAHWETQKIETLGVVTDHAHTYTIISNHISTATPIDTPALCTPALHQTDEPANPS